MDTVKGIYKFLDSQFPFKSAEEWDKVGLVFGSPKKTINKIMVCLDVTKKVIDESIANQIDLIISHHPFIFEDNLAVEYEKAPYKRDLVQRFQNTGIALIALHTNYDGATDGTARNIVKKLGVRGAKNIPGTKYGKTFDFTGNIGSVEQLLYTKLGLKNVLSNVEHDSLIFEKLAILPGSGSIQDMILAKKAGADLVITSDVKWSEQITAQEEGINIVVVSHAIENVFVENLVKILTKKYKRLSVKSSLMKELLKV